MHHARQGLYALALLASLTGCSGSNSAADMANGGDGSTGGPTGGSVGFFHTQGSQIVDSNGTPVRLTGVSWFGMETDYFAPHGLDKRSLGSMLDQIESVGFNSIRIPFCTQMFDSGSTPKNIDFTKNPDLQGKTPLQILDAIVTQAGARRLRIILDRHRPDAYSQSALWYTGQYSEQRWIADWTMLASHYRNNSTVVGFDLHNEPTNPATWGDNSMTNDWRAAAQRAGNAIQAVHPEILLIVEGIQEVNNQYYWNGGNLLAAGTLPVQLTVANHVVYSPHDYPASVYGQPWFSDPSYPKNLPGLWDKFWGYLVTQNTAPVWIGEYGTKLQTDSDIKWLNSLVSYIKTNQVSSSFWCWNPDSADTGGILQDDWNSVNQNKIDAIQPGLAPSL
jgi:aryl-phospho-beta-D-glucosidase BglC (GH1 family)